MISDNGWNGIYENMPLEEIPWHSEEPPEYLVELVEKKEVEGPVLDICCGTGTSAVYLAKNGFEVYGIDISEKAIDLAMKRAKRANVKCYFLSGNAIKLPYPDENFNFIFDRGCFHHIPEKFKERFVDGMASVLKRGGKYHLNCFSDKDPYFNGLSKEEIKNYFSKYFDVKYIKDVRFKEKDGINRRFYSSLMEKK